MYNIRRYGAIAAIVALAACGESATPFRAPPPPPPEPPPVPEASIVVDRVAMGAECWVSSPPRECGVRMHLRAPGPDCMTNVKGTVTFVRAGESKTYESEVADREVVWPGDTPWIDFTVLSRDVREREDFDRTVQGTPAFCPTGG